MTRRRHRTRRAAGRRRRPAGFSAGFTLVELLVVIGIVVVLMSILLPAVGKARVQAQSAMTQRRIASIAEAMERYHQDHKAYPGVISNDDIGAGYTAPGLAGGNLTMAENLVLTMCGGFAYNDSDRTKPQVVTGDIGKGPLNLSPAPTRRTRRTPYIEASPGQLFAAAYNPADPASGAINGPTNPLELPGPPLMSDSNVPEFVDAYSPPRAIVYMRAYVGGEVIPDPPGGGPAPLDYPEYFVDPGGKNPRRPQHDFRQLTPYRRDAVRTADRKLVDGTYKGDFVFSRAGDTKEGDDPTEYDHTHDYMRHPTIANTPRGKDKFILISAGPDRRYGTKDDIRTGP